MTDVSNNLSWLITDRFGPAYGRNLIYKKAPDLPTLWHLRSSWARRGLQELCLLPSLRINGLWTPGIAELHWFLFYNLSIDCFAIRDWQYSIYATMFCIDVMLLKYFSMLRRQLKMFEFILYSAEIDLNVLRQNNILKLLCYAVLNVHRPLGTLFFFATALNNWRRLKTILLAYTFYLIPKLGSDQPIKIKQPI